MTARRAPRKKYNKLHINDVDTIRYLTKVKREPQYLVAEWKGFSAETISRIHRDDWHPIGESKTPRPVPLNAEDYYTWLEEAHPELVVTQPQPQPEPQREPELDLSKFLVLDLVDARDMLANQDLLIGDLEDVIERARGVRDVLTAHLIGR
jgi:hypothetical protein